MFCVDEHKKFFNNKKTRKKAFLMHKIDLESAKINANIYKHSFS